MKFLLIGISILLVVLSTTFIQAQGSMPSNVQSLWRQATKLKNQQNFSEAAKKIKQAIDLFLPQQKNPHYQLIIARLYDNYGTLHGGEGMGNFQTSYQYQEKARLAIEQTNDTQYKGLILHNTANTYLYLEKHKEAAPLVEKAIQLARKNNDDILVVKLYGIASRIYEALSLHDVALSYLEKAERIIEKAPDKHQVYHGQIHFNFGIIYFLDENYQQALDHYQQAVKYHLKAHGPENFKVISAYNQLASVYIKLDQTQKAKAIIQQVMQIDNPVARKGKAGYLYNLGIIHHLEKNYPKAIEVFQEAIKVQLKTFGGDTPDNTEIYWKLGLAYKAQGKFKLALQTFQKVLMVNNTLFDSPDWQQNPLLKGAVYKEEQLQILGDKALAFKDWFTATQNSKYLHQACATYRFLLKEIKTWKTSLSDEHDLLLLIKRSHHIFTDAIEVMYLLYNLTKKPQYLAEAFDITEQSKAYILLRSLHTTTRSNQDKTSQLEDNLSHEINDLQEKLIAEENKSTLNSQKINHYKDQIFTLKASRDSLITAFQKFAPEYYQTKYQFKIASVKNIQEKLLAPQEALIEYILANKQLFIFIISKGHIAMKKIPLSDDFHLQIKKLRKSIIEKNFNNFTRLSHHFYQQLIQPLVLPSSISKLWVVPSGVLYYLPWEMLLTQPYKKNKVDYRKLNYLLKKYIFSYDYSATLMLNKQMSRWSMKKAKLMAFSPDFKTQVSPASKDRLRNDLSPLAGALDEVKALDRIYAGEVFVGQNATEEQFRKHLKEAQVLHLATHALIDDEQPAFSRLLFSLSSKDTLHDGYLHAYELYNLELNTELVTLSACNTGFGKIQTGEGVMSLGRAFAYAGSPNILMSLWSVPDKSTSKIMIQFYKNLATGLPKDVALRQAKLTYLNHSDNLATNPFYWSSFILIGDPKPLNLKPATPFYKQAIFLWAIGMCLLGSIFYVVGKHA